MALIGPPMAERVLVERASHLGDAGGTHLAARLVEFEAGRIPIEAEMGNAAAGRRLGRRHQVLVAHIEDAAGKRPVPVAHEVGIELHVTGNAVEAVGVDHGRGVEILRPGGKRHVERMAQAVDQPGIGNIVKMRPISR
jgi:hypothetical protein